MIEPVAQRWPQKLQKFIWWGRTYLYIRNGDERRKHLEALTLAIKVELEKIKERQNALLKEEQGLKTYVNLLFRQCKHDSIPSVGERPRFEQRL